MNFSAGTLQARRQWDDIFKVLKGKNCQPRTLYVAKKKKSGTWKMKEKENLPMFKGKKTNAEGVHHHYNCLQEMLKGFHQAQTKGCWTH